MILVHRYAAMDVRRLAIFLEVVDQGGFSRAADALDISQPSVSQAVRELENDLGTPLFHRLARTVALTPAGEALMLSARQVPAQHGERPPGRRRGRRAGAGPSRPGLPTHIGRRPARPAGRRLPGRLPQVSIVLADPQDTAALVEFVRTGRSEVGLVEHVAVDDLTSVALGAQDFLVVLPPGTKVASPYRLRQLAAMPLVAAPVGSSTRGLLDDALRAVGASANVVVEAAQREALLPLIASGAGAGLLPRPLAELARALGCAVVEPQPPVSRSVALVHRTAQLTPAAVRFVELARNSVGKPR